MRTWPGIRASRASDSATRDMLEQIDIYLRQVSGALSSQSNNVTNSSVTSLSIPTVNEGDAATAGSEALPMAGATDIPGVFRIPRVSSAHPDPAGADKGLTVRNIEAPYTTFEAQHVTLVASTDTEITFSALVSLVRIVNWSTSRVILVKDGVIASDTAADATRVGFAPTASVPSTRTLPYQTLSIHLRAAGAADVSIEGYR